MIKKIPFLLFIVLMYACSAGTGVNNTTNNNSNGNNTVEEETFTYLGAFKLPRNRSKISDGLYGSFQGEGGAAAYNQYNNSLFLSARFEDSNYQRLHKVIAEVSIPEPVIGPLDKLPEAQLVTGYTDAITGVVDQIKVKHPGGEGHGIGGLMVYGDYLIGTIYRWHNCGTPITFSHFYTLRTNFNKANTVGPLAIDAGTLNGFTAPAGAMAGYMTMIPDEWQARFGYKALTGSLHGSENGGILKRCSSGTAAFGFNPADFLTSATINGKQFIYHPVEHIMSSSYYAKAHDINGMAFVSYREKDGKDKWAVIYALTYGNPPYSWNVGYKAASYDAKLFFYDPEELLKVSTGEKKQYELVPYKTMTLSRYFYNKESMQVKSMAYNPDQGILYIVEERANGSRPVVHMFSLN